MEITLPGKDRLYIHDDVPGEFPAQRPVTRSVGVFFDLRPNKWLSKHWWGWWFETPWCPLWRHCNVRQGHAVPQAYEKTAQNETYLGWHVHLYHYDDVIMGTIASQIASLTIVYSTVYSGADQRTSTLRVTGLCVGNSPGTGEFPAQMASCAKNVSIWWRDHDLIAIRPSYHFLPINTVLCKQGVYHLFRL